MRLILVLSLALAGTAPAQENIIQKFQGTGSPVRSTPFKVQDRWEIRWESPDPLAFSLCEDGTEELVAGVAGSGKGSLYQKTGGTFFLKIDPAAKARAWNVTVVELGAIPSSPPPVTENYVPAVEPHLAGSTVTPAATPTAAPAPAPTPPAGILSMSQAPAVVLIKGDSSEGTGFLIKMPDGPAVITNQHVIYANPNIHVLTTTGEEIEVTGLKGASDRDLAMFSVKDNQYTYFTPATDLQKTVQPGDEVITPGNSEGGEVMLNTSGKVVGLGPEKIEITNPVYHGNSGGPIYHANSKTVIGVVTMGVKVKPQDDLDAASFANKNSAIAGPVRYFGLRFDNVPTWETFDWNRYLSETTFLKNFHDQSRCLDSFLNGAEYEKMNLANANSDEGLPDSHYFLKNDKITTAATNFKAAIADVDRSQRLDATRELTMDLDSVADADMATIQNPANFYSFDQQRAAAEVKYRQWLRGEIGKAESRISDLGH